MGCVSDASSSLATVAHGTWVRALAGVWIGSVELLTLSTTRGRGCRSEPGKAGGSATSLFVIPVEDI